MPANVPAHTDLPTVQVVHDPATGLTAIGLDRQAAADLATLLDALPLAHDFGPDLLGVGHDDPEALRISIVVSQVRTALQKIAGY